MKDSINHAVIGPTFGDEGKGKAVSFLCREIRRTYRVKPLVVRFQGGSQAGHTVEPEDGVRHVFGHLGSGTFDGCPTLLTRDFIFNPLTLQKEVRVLAEEFGISHGKLPRIYVDPRAKVTTPMDMIVNQMAERLRGGDKHGSCGLGINETIRRHEDYLEITVAMLEHLTKDQCVEIMRDLHKNWMPKRLASMGFDAALVAAALDEIPSHMIAGLGVTFFDSLHNVDVVVREDTVVLSTNPYRVFEGAQGLLLGEDYQEFFPHLTHSKTGLTNVVTLLKEIDDLHLSVTYPMRWYMTRHGAGPFPTANQDETEPPSRLFTDRTNRPNDWQGTLRFGALDINRIRDVIYSDFATAVKMHGVHLDSLTIHLNCLDQLEDEQKIRVRWDGEDFEWSPMVLLIWMERWFSALLSTASVPGTPLTFLLGYGPKPSELYPLPTGFPRLYVESQVEPASV